MSAWAARQRDEGGKVPLKAFEKEAGARPASSGFSPDLRQSRPC
jgi:hypothetical protein